MDKTGGLLYASRAGIPTNKKLEFNGAYRQVCIYAFSPEELRCNYSDDIKTPMEKIARAISTSIKVNP